MRFLADESCDFAVVRALRSKGFDVLAVSEICPGAEDRQVIELAKKEGQVLLTEDKDFLSFRSIGNRGGLLSFPARARHELCRAVLNLISREGPKLNGSFVVLQPGRVRIRRFMKKSGSKSGHRRRQREWVVCRSWLRME